MKLPTETEVIQHAEVAARYYRALILEGIPPSHAALMAASYMRDVLLSEEQPDVWEDEG